MKRGFLYIANGQKFVDEAVISAQSLRRFHSEPICLICTSDIDQQDLSGHFDTIIVDDNLKKHLYLAKIIGLQLSPFDQTIFLDGDTFVTDNISELFDLLEIVDFATTLEQKKHTSKYKDLKYYNIFPEFNTGVIVYRNSPIMKKVLDDWLSYCLDRNLLIDMPGLREAVLMNFNDVRFSILPNEYNEHGFSTMLLLHGKVKVIHERLGYKRGYYTPHFMNVEEMDKFAGKINKKTYKRIYIPKLGIISYRWSPQNIITKIKKKLGYKRLSKNR